MQLLTLGSSGKMLSTRRLYLGLSGPQQPQTPATNNKDLTISKGYTDLLTFCHKPLLSGLTILLEKASDQRWKTPRDEKSVL